MASSLIVTLGLNAVDWIRGLTKAEAQMQGLVTATAKQSAAIDRQIKSLERQAATVGMTTREIKLYELAQKGATSAQLAQAGAALRTVENFERIQKAARGLGLVLGTLGVGSITGVIALFSSIVKGIDDMDDLRDATGASIEKISALDDIFRRTMGSADSVGTVLVRMNKVLNDTEPGTKAANIIKGIGLEVEALKQLDPAEAARQMAVAFSKFADDGSKGRAFLELFNKTVKEIGPAMDELAKQTKLVGTVTNEQVEEAKKFRQELFNMEKNILDVARSLAGPLVTAINATSEAMKKAKEEGKGFFGQNFAGQLAAINSLFGTNFGVEPAKDDNKRIDELNKQLASGNGLRSGRNKLEKELNDLLAKRDASNLAGFAKTAGSFGGGAPSLGEFEADKPKKTAAGIAKATSEAQRYLETLQKQAEKTQELSILEQTLLDIQKGRIEGLTPKLKEQILVAAQEADARKITTDLLKEEKRVREAVASMLEKAEAQAAAEIQAIASGNEALQLEIDMLGKDEVAKAALNNARLESVISIKEEELAFLELSNAVSALVSQRKAEIAELRKRQQLTTKKADVENFQKVADDAKKATDDVSEFTREASRNIQDALGDTLLSTLKGDFQSIGKMWSDLILKMIAQALAARLNEKLFGKDGLGGLIGPALNAIFGGGGTGGGETGDFARMDRRQSVGSREVASSMAKSQMGGQIVQNINIGDYATRNDVMNAMNAAKEQAKAEIFRSQRSRGQFATS